MAAGGQYQFEFVRTRGSPSVGFRHGEYAHPPEALHSQQSRPLTQPDDVALDVQGRGRAGTMTSQTGRFSPTPSRPHPSGASSRSFSRTLSLRTREKKRQERKTSEWTANGVGPDDAHSGPEQQGEQTGAMGERDCVGYVATAGAASADTVWCIDAGSGGMCRWLCIHDTVRVLAGHLTGGGRQME